MANPIIKNAEDENTVMSNESNEVNEYERLSLELAPAFIKMIREMTNLPDNHFAWSYMNPTRYHLGNQTPYEDLIQEDQHKRDFEHWLDGILFLHQELKERKKDDHLQSSPNDKAAQDEKIDKRSFNDKKEEEQGSSSVVDTPSSTISWGERKTEGNEESLRLWLQTNKPKAEKRNEAKDDATNLEEMTLCSVCDQEMPRSKPGINTCQECQQWVMDSKDLNTTKFQTKAQNDDETEFQRIPIAGENDSDYDTDSDEYKEEENSRLPYLDGVHREDDHSSDNDDDEFIGIPIVHAIPGTEMDEQGQEDKMKVKDDGVETTEITLTSTLTDNITTPTKTKQNEINELLNEATKQGVLPIPSFDASIAYLDQPCPKETDALAFLFGKRRDGIIQYHHLSPIPIHENRYQTLYI